MRARYCKRCRYEIKEGDTVCRHCHEPYVPSPREIHDGTAYVSRKCMGTVAKIALIYGIMSLVTYIVCVVLQILKNAMYYM